MSKTRVTIEEADGSKLIAIVNESTNQILDLLAGEPTQPDISEVVTEFLKSTGTILSLETPDSSNIQSIKFNAITGEIGFVFDNDSESLYPATFKDFVEAMRAPSFGKLQWQYRRAAGQLTPKLGDRVKVITARQGATGADGHTGTVTNLPISNGINSGLHVRLDGTKYPAGVWGLGVGAKVEIL